MTHQNFGITRHPQVGPGREKFQEVIMKWLQNRKMNEHNNLDKI